MQVRFGDCVLDPETRELLVRGEVVHLSPKAFQFLEILLQSRPRALSKSEIHERLWPGTFVSDGTLTSLLAEVRSAIEDEPHDSRFVRTAPGILIDFDNPQRWHNSSGRLFLDRPHSFRLDASFTTSFKLTAGVQGYVQSGAPLNKFGYFHFNAAGIHLTRRGYAGRLPTLWEANLMLGYPLTVGPVTVTVQAYVFNVFNNQIRTRQAVAYGLRRPPGYPDTLYDPEVPADRVNPNYGKIRERQDPRLVRGAVKISF